MSTTIGVGEFGLKLIDALGLKGRKVRSIKIEVPLEDVVTVTAEFMITDIEAGEIIGIMKQYKLTKKTDGQT